MLNKPIEEIVIENGKVVGVKSEGEVRPLPPFPAPQSSDLLGLITANTEKTLSEPKPTGLGLVSLKTPCPGGRSPFQHPCSRSWWSLRVLAVNKSGCLSWKGAVPVSSLEAALPLAL